MAYNKAREEKKWQLWKEAEEKQLRSLGVSEKDIEKLRVHDWAIFNSDRRYYQRMQETGTYLEEVAADMTQPEIKTVEDFLDNIENQQLYQVLIKVDRLTLQAILLQIQGYSIAEIAAILGMKEDTVYKRLGRLKQKNQKTFGIVSKKALSHGLQGERTKPLALFSFVWRKRDCSLKTEYPFAKYILFVIVMSISVSRGTP